MVGDDAASAVLKAHSFAKQRAFGGETCEVLLVVSLFRLLLLLVFILPLCDPNRGGLNPVSSNQKSRHPMFP